MHSGKPGLRVLGIAESYRGRHDEGAVSRLAGVVMRRDLRIDGFGTDEATVGGTRRDRRPWSGWCGRSGATTSGWSCSRAR